MNSNTDQIKKIERDKQGKNYLSHIYSVERRPITNYPELLANLIINKTKLKNSILLDAGCGRGDMLHAFKRIKC